jgi:hypothetical protein
LHAKLRGEMRDRVKMDFMNLVSLVSQFIAARCLLLAACFSQRLLGRSSSFSLTSWRS